MAGRYHHGGASDHLEDESAGLGLPPASPRPDDGDLVAGTLLVDDDGPRLSEWRLLAPAHAPATATLRRLASLRPRLEARRDFHHFLREHFTSRGFLELETPTRVLNPGLEPQLAPFAAGVGSDGSTRYLITSPELHLKPFLSAGYERIFELARCFRDDELGPWHQPEFTMLEWYRSHADLDALADDLAELLPLAAEAVGRRPDTAVTSCRLDRGLHRESYHDVFHERTGQSAAELDFDERQRLFVERVEPSLGWGVPTLLLDYPVDEAALARRRPGPPGGPAEVAARMELFLCGKEIANAFDELTDPDEQRRRHEADRETRRAAGDLVPPLDEGFLAALEHGMPPSAGIALGVDRLLTLLLGLSSLDELLPFPEPAGGPELQ
ncbi:MAG: amino acid--tRNA ligase-related protein [Acidobacteriota bacterium]